MMGSEKISFERLADWAEGRLPEEEASAVMEQLERADAETRARAEWLQAFNRASESTVFEAPPREVRENLTHRFAGYAEGVRQPGILHRIVATLSFEGGMQPAFGVRSAGAGESQGQLVYTTDVADIALNVLPRPGGKVDLDGQVFPTGDADPDAFVVQLLSGGTDAGIATTDELGEFAFEAILPDEYDILVSTDEVEILISPVALSA